jgi:large subunit ribosomal protein L29
VSIEAKDLRGNDPQELRSTVRKLEEDLFKHRLKKTTSQLENTMLIRQTRRDIARVHTVLSQRLRAAGGAAAPANETVPAADKAAAKPAKAAAKEAATEAAAKPAPKKPAKKPEAKQSEAKQSEAKQSDKKET